MCLVDKEGSELRLALGEFAFELRGEDWEDVLAEGVLVVVDCFEVLGEVGVGVAAYKTVALHWYTTTTASDLRVSELLNIRND